MLDDLSPLHQVDEATATAPVTLFAPRPTPRYRTYERAWSEQVAGYTSYMANGPAMTAYRPIERPDGSKARQPLDAGKNPPLGVVIHYAFAEQPQDEVTLTILDGDGHAIRSFSSKSVEGPRVPVEAGANRFVWDLRYPKPTALENGEKKADRLRQDARGGSGSPRPSRRL